MNAADVVETDEQLAERLTAQFRTERQRFRALSPSTIEHESDAEDAAERRWAARGARAVNAERVAAALDGATWTRFGSWAVDCPLCHGARAVTIYDGAGKTVVQVSCNCREADVRHAVATIVGAPLDDFQSTGESLRQVEVERSEHRRPKGRGR